MRRAAVGWLLATAMAAPTGAAAERLRYDPETCSTDAEGKVYLRLSSGVAFGFPAGALKYLGGKVLYDPPPVPSPDDPEGCPGNPILTSSARLLAELPAPATSTPGEAAPDIRMVVGIIGVLARVYDDDGNLTLQGGMLDSMARYRENGNWCETTSAGWDVCYGTPQVNAAWDKRGGAIYVAREDMHPLRSGAPITLDCWPPDWAGRRRCSPSYQPLPRVSLALDFDDDVIPVESFFELDRAITAWLKAARVPALDFELPDEMLYRR